MKLFGHPVHLMLNHFPAALFPLEGVLYVMFYCTGNQSFMAGSFYAAFGGVVLGWLSGLTGIIDLFKIPKDNSKAMTAGFIHGGIQATVMIAYTVIVFLLYKTYPQFPEASISLVTVRILLVAVLLVGNYVGGNLLLKHKIGIDT